MIVVTAFAQVRPETRGQVAEALLRAQAETVTEDGCEAYRFYAALDDDSCFVAVENWQSVDALQAHLQSPHVAELIGALTDALVAPLDIRAYDSTRVDLG
ncbi:MAG: antibiotic biosynthesis monooxygenase [Geodermatophilaceae bacterium]|nr:antibiotic biosynthesis monooxygenase [Geodermatophilaceae bacterium]